MPTYFAAPTYYRQGVVAGFALGAPDFSGTPAGTGNSVSFVFQNSNITVLGVLIQIATGYQHWVTIGGNTYAYVQQNGDTPSTVATYLMNAINGAPDPLVTATAAGGVLTLSPRQNTGAAISCMASDGVTEPVTLFELTGNELVPTISKGVLFAQGQIYAPATAPVLPAAPASQHSWLFYSSASGWYWKSSSTPTVSTDACVGWVVTSATAVIAVSSRKIGTGAEAPLLPGGPAVVAMIGESEDTGVPGTPNFAAAETNSQLVIGELTIAGAANTDGIDFATFILYYVAEGAGPAATLTAALTAGATALSASAALPASTPGSVAFTFYNTTTGGVTIGPGYVHSIGIGAATYEYSQQTEDTGATIAAALAALIDAEGDPNAEATAVGSTVVLTALQNTAVHVTCSASDGNTPQTLIETEPSYVAIDEEIVLVTASNGSAITRAQKASTAAAHASGAKIWPVTAVTVVFALPQFAYGTPAWPTVIGQIPFQGQALVAADCWVSNEIGPSPITTKCFTGQGPYAVDSLGNPLAPDVGGFTAGVTLGINIGGQPYYQFSGTVTLGPAPGNTAEIDVVMTSAAGVATTVYRFLGPFTANAVLSWASVVYPQPTSGAALSFTPTVVPLNVDNAPTVSSYTVAALTVPNGTGGSGSATTPEAPYSVTLTEVGPRTLKLSDQTTYTSLQVAIEESIVPAGGFALGTMLHVQMSADGGSTWFDAGAGIYASDRVDEDGTHTYFVTTITVAGFLVQTTAQSFKARAWSLSQYVDAGPAGAVVSATCTVGVIGPPAANGAALGISPVTPVTDPTTGWQYWQQSLTVQTPGSADSSCAWYIITVQNCDGSGNPGPAGVPTSNSPIATERQWQTCGNDGQQHVFPPLNGGYLPAGTTQTFTRYKVYGVSRSAADPVYGVTAASWTSGVATLTIGSHAFSVGQTAYISDMAPVGFNGIVTVSAVTGTTISYAMSANPGAYTSGGMVNKPGWQDPTYAVLQQWPGGATSSLQDFGAIPAGAIPVSRLSAIASPLIVNSGGALAVGTDQTGNVFVNPGFEQGLTGWGTSGVFGVSTSVFLSGSGSLQLPATQFAVAYQQFQCKPGDQWLAQFWCDEDAGMVAGQLYIAVNFYSDDACQNIIPGEGTSQGNVNCVAGSWLILSGSWTVPAGALSMLVGVAVASATQAGKYFYIDSCSLKPVVPGQQLQLGNGLQALGSGATQINNGSTIGFNVGGQVIFLNVQSLPSLPTIAGGNSYYPVGSVVQLSSTGVLYQNVGNVWVTPQSPAQMVAGALAAGVTIAASEVTAGAFVGSTMTLNLNGIITTLGNVYDNAYGAYAGVMVQSTANTLYRALLFNEGLVAFQPNGNQAVSIIGAVGGGNISVQNASGVTTFSVTGQVGQCSATQFIANGSSGRTGTITLSSISQIQVVGGLVVGWS